MILDIYIEKEIQYSNMNRGQIKSDNAVPSIIINSLEKSNQEYLRGCKTAYNMIDRLKKSFLSIWPSPIKIILEYKIINLKLIKQCLYSIY